jgi:RNA polymerase sigma factor (sigma-70 family)
MAIEKNINQASSLLELIKKGDPKTLKKLYDENRKPFIGWANQFYQADEEDAIEIFQKAFTIFYFNVKDAKLVELTSSVKTYLYSIGKNLFREKFRDKHNKHVDIDDAAFSAQINEKVDTNILDEYQNDYQRDLVKKLLNEIGEPCKTLLTLIFIHNYSNDAVVEEMNYSDERVVRKRKSLCLKRMREIVAGKKDSDLLFD